MSAAAELQTFPKTSTWGLNFFFVFQTVCCQQGKQPEDKDLF